MAPKFTTTCQVQKFPSGWIYTYLHIPHVCFKQTCPEKNLQRCKGLPCFFNVRILLWMSTTPSKDFFWCLLRGFLQQLLENPGGLVCSRRWQRHLSTNFDKCSSSKPPRFQASLECRSVSSHPDSRRCQNNVDLHVHEAKSSMLPHFLLAKYVIDINTARIANLICRHIIHSQGATKGCCKQSSATVDQRVILA